MSANGDISNGVLDLARALRVVQQEFELETVTGSKALPNGHEITLRWSRDRLTLEDESGAMLLLNGTEAR
jgi:hypothetical protein